VFLFSLSLICSVFYIWDLGFYSDDWGFLRNFSLAEDDSFWGLFEAFGDPNAAMRPGQKLYQAALYWLFGLEPAGYHLVNSAVLSIGAVLFYLLLREVGESRLLALAIALVFAFLPHYSTVRFWYAADQAALAMVLYFACVHADLRAFSAKALATWAWKAASVACLLASALCYEVVIPLFILNPLILLLKNRYFSDSRGASGRRNLKLLALTAIHLIALFAIVAFKITATTRLGTVDPGGQVVWFARLLALALAASYGDYGLGLPVTLTGVLTARFSWLSLIASFGIGYLVYAYVRSVAAGSAKPLVDKGHLLRLAIAGLVVFALGYVIFLAGRNALITPTGMNNRIAIAAAVGVAISFVGAAGWLCGLLGSDRRRARVFSLSILGLVVSGFLINFGLSTYWRDSYAEQQRDLAGLQAALPELPSGQTVLLDGVCPYLGPAAVFESPWDLSGALAVIYRDATLRADVVTPSLQISERAVQTEIYGEATRYAFDQGVTVYHHGLRQAFSLPTAEAARLYFNEISQGKGEACPLGRPGYGVPVLGGVLDILLAYRFGTLCGTVGGGKEGGPAGLASLLCRALRATGEVSK